jgi:3-hydroxyisobutyrate dehydrogenase
VIAFFGMGLLGSGFVRAYRRRGEEVQVWNRTPEKARALEEHGARAFADPAEAARGAARVHVTLSDDAGFSPGVVIVDHTTTSATGTAARAARWAERGVAFQHAPVFMGPQNALDGTGIMLASGDEARFESLRPALEKMTGKLVYLGPAPERAASFKLLGNLFLMFLTGGMAEMLNLAKALDIDPKDAATLFDAFNPGSMVPARMARMIGGDFAHASWELSMARKDARLMIEEGDRRGVPLTMLPAIAATMDRYLERGHGKDDWTVIAKDALSR